jgi:hypothetical protein
MMMNPELFNLLLKALQPATLAYLVRDLEDYRVDWRYYPEQAPAPAQQQALLQILENLKTYAAELAQAEGLNFYDLLQAAIDEQHQGDWASQRDRQEQENWTQDLE